MGNTLFSLASLALIAGQAYAGNSIDRPPHAREYIQIKRPEGSIRRAHNDHAPAGFVSQKNPSIIDERFVMHFFNTTDATSVDQTLSELTAGKVRVASTADLLGKESRCSAGVCAIATRQQVDELRSQASALPEFNVIGKKTVQKFLRFKQEPQNEFSSDGRSSGPVIFNTINPNPSLYYIPDLGYQELGAYFPASATPFLTGNSAITEVKWEVDYYHTNPTDLIITLGYDDTSIGGTTNLFTTVSSNQPGFSGLNSLSGISYDFNGNYPDSYFYFGAQDTVFLNDGYIDTVDFAIFWEDPIQVLPDLTPYTGAGSSHYWNTTPAVLGQGYIEADATVLNSSTIDVSNLFSVGWYVTQASSCSSVAHNPNASNTYLVGYQDYTFGLLANNYAVQSLVNADLHNAVNTVGNYMPGDDYCLWAYTDELNTVSESTETNNFYNYGTFKYDPASTKYDPAGTGIHEDKQQVKLTIYPNPVAETMTINLPEQLNGKIIILSITEMNGQVARTETISTFTQKVSTSVSDLSPGVYVARIQDGRNEFKSTFIKQ